jgi:hypothetical protein
LPLSRVLIPLIHTLSKPEAGSRGSSYVARSFTVAASKRVISALNPGRMSPRSLSERRFAGRLQ